MAEESWTIRRLLRWSTEWLTGRGVDAPRLDAELLLAHALNLRRLDLFLDPDRPLYPEELAAYKSLIIRRGKREPTAYILGKRAFWTLELAVGPGVLIPRPETERVVEAILERLPDRTGSYTLLDVGIGSGAILFSLLEEFPNAQGLGIDLTPAALAWAAKNAQHLGLTERVQLWTGDLLAPLGADLLLDAIVANPPYVATHEWGNLAPEIQLFEPSSAFLAGKDGLDLYRRLLPQTMAHLQSGGWLAVEIGAIQGEAVADLARRAGFTAVAILPDYARLPRVVVGQKG